MEDVWIMDSGCSRHMTGHRKWFSSLNPVSTKEYITFGDNGQGKVLDIGSISLSAKLCLREVAFVQNLGFNLVSISQLLDEGFEVRFKKGACCVLDAEETLVCSLLPFGQDRGMEDVWIMDSSCSRHMTGHRKWFSSLNPMSTTEYITFGDNGQGKVLGIGVSLSAKLSPREVASISAGFNLVSISQLLDEGFEILEAKQVVETCEVCFDETMPCTIAFELSSDDEEGTPIFEDEEGVVDVGDV
ncbi:hypothetical protein U9M48_031275 [Paspalum notatum var. saurae]|uniref:Retrovirus-related Pol polyprotein from transposon TNT 1-94-like beta-barrel domain-containing protein n=1 Tax=Paspalum notatum var. saurae TaxID=547442 RepID=A0AAQ3X485_PASNO